MKTKYFLLAILFLCGDRYTMAQNSETEAEYAYTKAEKAFLDSDFEKSILYCNEAAQKLGKTNSKILYLQIKNYQKLIETNCQNDLLNDTAQLNQILKSFFDSTDVSTYPKEKYFEILEFRDTYSDFKKTGCVIKFISYEDLGIELKEVNPQKATGMMEKMYYKSKNITVAGLEVTKLNDGLLKEKTSLKEGFIIQKISGNNALTKNEFSTFLKTLQLNKQKIIIEGTYPNDKTVYKYQL